MLAHIHILHISNIKRSEEKRNETHKTKKGSSHGRQTIIAHEGKNAPHHRCRMKGEKKTRKKTVFSQFATMGRLPWQWMLQQTKNTKTTTTMTNFKRWFWFLSSHARNKSAKAHSRNGFGHQPIEESFLPSRFTNVMMAQLCTFLNFECRKLAHTTCQLKEMLACRYAAAEVVAAVADAATDTAATSLWKTCVQNSD